VLCIHIYIYVYILETYGTILPVVSYKRVCPFSSVKARSPPPAVPSPRSGCGGTDPHPLTLPLICSPSPLLSHCLPEGSCNAFGAGQGVWEGVLEAADGVGWRPHRLKTATDRCPPPPPPPPSAPAPPSLPPPRPSREVIRVIARPARSGPPAASSRRTASRRGAVRSPPPTLRVSRATPCRPSTEPQPRPRRPT
jgi:hypothetical protein